MASLEQKREAFRKYLESAGAIDGLSKALIRLYQEEPKPENACKFLRAALGETGCPTDEQVAESMAELVEARARIGQLEREIRGLRMNVRRTASETDVAIEAGFEELQTDAECESLLKKLLTRELLDELKGVKTPTYGSTLLDCVQSGFGRHDSVIGAYAADPEAYATFAKFFDPLIEEYHGGFGAADVQPGLLWGAPDELENPDTDGRYVTSTCVRCARSLAGIPFHPRMTEEQYEEVSDRVAGVVAELSGELAGVLHRLETIDDSARGELQEAGLLFKEGDPSLGAAQAERFFPAGRAVFANEAGSFVVWTNEADHLRIFAKQKGADIARVYQRLIDGVESLGKGLTFQHDDRLGYLNYCPSNLGTGIRASVHVRLPLLAADRAQLDTIATEHNLLVRDDVEGLLEVSNKRRLGLTEFETVKQFVDGVKALIEQEKELAAAAGDQQQEEPVAEELTVEEPAADVPAAEEPVSDEPAAEEATVTEAPEPEPVAE